MEKIERRGGPRAPRSPNRWKSSELARAMRAAAMAGVEIQRYDIDAATGHFSLVVRRDDDKPPADNPWLSGLESKR